MYIWRKRATADWLRVRCEELSRQFGPALAITERPGRALSIVEICTPTKKAGRTLVGAFGGSMEKLRTNWLEHFSRQPRSKPLRIGSRLIVVRSPDQKGADQTSRTIIIPAEAAFGTGEHVTTAMCLRLLERHTRKHPPGWSILDAGTGSGILAIAARCFGATRVLAIDNDPRASAIAKRSARANRVRSIEFRTSDVLKLKIRKKFDVITANLFSELLIKALPGFSRHITTNGCLILSGILRSQERAVATALRRNGFVLQEARRRGKWIALLVVNGRRSAPSPPRKKS